MTPTLATYIAANFEVTSSINTFDYPLIGSGFDATVWRGKAGTAFAGQVFVSTRGTEPPGVDIWGADADLATNVAARTQIIDMVNWWLRETTPTNAQAKQIKWDPLRTKPGDITVLEPGVVLANSVAGQDHLAGTTTVQVNGHSLGGHLATAFARIFGGETSAVGSVRTEGVSTFNSAGFSGAAGLRRGFVGDGGRLFTGAPWSPEVIARNDYPTMGRCLFRQKFRNQAACGTSARPQRGRLHPRTDRTPSHATPARSFA